MHRFRLVLAAALPCLALAAYAAEPDTAKGTPKVHLGDTATRQAQLKRAFENFSTRLTVLAGRLENGPPADKEKAKNLRKALKLIGDQGTAGRFDAVILGLTRKNADESIDTLRGLVRDNKELRQDLQRILTLLLDGDGLKKLAEKRERAKELLEKLKEARDKQERLQAQTEMGKQDAKGLVKAQDKITEMTKDALELPENAEEQDTEAIETVRKPVEEAVKEQQASSKQLGGNMGKAAGESQGKAVGKLNEAIKKLEEYLKQLRQEERQQKLADLLARSRKMLAQQIEVRDGTVKLDKDVSGTRDGKPTLLHAGRATRLSDQELAIVREANEALKLVRTEETAVAFVEAFEQVYKDADTVHTRLERTDVGAVTQAIENDVIATLEDIIKALEKAMQEPEDPEDAPRPRPGQPGDRKLVNFLQQLKMITAIQRRINTRTALYGKSYQGEQAPMPELAKDAKEKEQYTVVQKEMRDLSDRQSRLSKVTREMSRQQEARMQ